MHKELYLDAALSADVRAHSLHEAQFFVEKVHIQKRMRTVNVEIEESTTWQYAAIMY